MKQREVISAAPHMYAIILVHFQPAPLANSATIISVHPMYKKVPAAKLDIITFTASPAFEQSMPIKTPRGVAIENMNTN